MPAYIRDTPASAASASKRSRSSGKKLSSTAAPAPDTHPCPALVLAGREAEGRQLLKQLRAESVRRGIYQAAVAAALVAQGDTSGAIDWLEAAYRQRHPDLVRLNTDAFYSALRGNPRFQDLLRRVGFGR